MMATLPRGAAFLLPFCSGLAKILSPSPFPVITLSAEGFLVTAEGLAALPTDFDLVAALVALVTFFVLCAASATSNTAAVVCLFMFNQG
ncbi:hypothetical protein K0O23_12240 [Pontibacter aydingkolensis]|uniref:Secreted peptide n=1 Tax=Pontibacter aydingkolensis TaxID=1911536 RepID=A0ABS7CVH9_9BACT|nr:hypothetical protein [Pontibacter aydingkolensis]